MKGLAARRYFPAVQIVLFLLLAVLPYYRYDIEAVLEEYLAPRDRSEQTREEIVYRGWRLSPDHDPIRLALQEIAIVLNAPAFVVSLPIVVPMQDRTEIPADLLLAGAMTPLVGLCWYLVGYWLDLKRKLCPPPAPFPRFGQAWFLLWLGRFLWGGCLAVAVFAVVARRQESLGWGVGISLLLWCSFAVLATKSLRIRTS